MSDQETGTIEEPKKEPAPVSNAAAAPAEPKKPAAPAAKPSSTIAWLALLLIIAVAGGTAWVVFEAQRKEALLVNRLTELEAIAGRDKAALEALQRRWEGELQSGLGKLEATVGGDASRLAADLAATDARLVEQADVLARFSASDRNSWLMAEAEYLLRLANQRLIMAGDTEAAQALLASADNVLRELDDTRLHAVRAAVAADLAAVRAVPTIDVEGIYLRLAAQIEQAGKLRIFQMPELEAQPQPAAAQEWQERLRQGYESALSKLSRYIIIRRRDVPMQTLMNPQWEGLVRQNLRMLLEQAQVALLSGNQTLYSESLGRAQHWVDEFMESDEAGARAISRELTQMVDLRIVASVPDLSRSMQALDDAIAQEMQQGGDQ